MHRKLFYRYKIVIKTIFPVRPSCEQKEGEINNGGIIHNSVKKCLFQAFTACLLLEVLLLRKAGQTPMSTGKHSEFLRSRKRSRSWMDFFAVSFVVDIATYRWVAFACLPQWSWFLYQTTPYCICVLMIKTVWKFHSRKKLIVINP